MSQDFPSDTQAKRGRRTIKGWAIARTEKLGCHDPCPMPYLGAARGRDFKRCCLRSGRYDGAERDDYWR